MQNSRFLYWGAQLGGWFVYSILLFLANYAEDPSKINYKFLISIFVFVLSGILVTHSMRWLFFRWNWLGLKLAPLIPRIFMISIVSAAIVIIINFSLSVALGKTELGSITILKILTQIFACAVLMILWNAIYFSYHFFQKSIKQEMENLQLVASQHEIELKNLRSQLNPHFLFNSLNSIRALIDIEPEKSKYAITTLSNLLRNSLLLGKNSLVPVKEEITLVENYLQLEKIRFEERLKVSYELDEQLSDFMIPPFIIQTQVENAIKHGISKLMEGGEIRIKTLKSPHAVVIEVSNTGELSNQKESGIGFENSMRRLALQYMGKSTIRLEEKEGNVICTIEIGLI
jgi:LytS/YehU family sensor histidine kinase